MNKLFYWLGFSLFLGLINPVLSKSDLPIKKISEDSKNRNSKVNNKEINYKRFVNLAYSVNLLIYFDCLAAAKVANVTLWSLLTVSVIV